MPQQRPDDAQNVVIDYATGTVLVDGVPVPYWIEEGGPTVEQFGTDGLALVRIPVFVVARAVDVRNKPDDVPAPTVELTK